ncbi:hypothetical protein HDU77_009538 [Chytriomyces hyalinus]|nr:hypothetical protein HDU77_009538 [Chytriomyces hyalinus]
MYPMLGEYQLLRTIGEGEFGKVKLAVSTGTAGSPQREVAIKLCKKTTIAAAPNGYTKLMREISTLKLVRSHPFIISLIEVIETDSYIAIVMELAKGGELFEHILKSRALSEDVTRVMFAQIICAVGFIHSIGIVHRDLKLENILLDENENVLVTDFGFANKAESVDGLLRTSCGSPCYAAPELVTSDGYVGEIADIWSCGVILFSMIAGYLPFDDDPTNPDGDNINILYHYIMETKLEFPAHVPLDCQDLINRILVPDPNIRASMNEIMSHVWLKPVRHIFEEEMQRRQTLGKVALTGPGFNQTSSPPVHIHEVPSTAATNMPSILSRSASLRSKSTPAGKWPGHDINESSNGAPPPSPAQSIKSNMATGDYKRVVPADPAVIKITPHTSPGRGNKIGLPVESMLVDSTGDESVPDLQPVILLESPKSSENITADTLKAVNAQIVDSSAAMDVDNAALNSTNHGEIGCVLDVPAPAPNPMSSIINPIKSATENRNSVVSFASSSTQVEHRTDRGLSPKSSLNRFSAPPSFFNFDKSLPSTPSRQSSIESVKAVMTSVGIGSFAEFMKTSRFHDLNRPLPPFPQSSAAVIRESPTLLRNSRNGKHVSIVEPVQLRVVEVDKHRNSIWRFSSLAWMLGKEGGEVSPVRVSKTPSRAASRNSVQGTPMQRNISESIMNLFRPKSQQSDSRNESRASLRETPVPAIPRTSSPPMQGGYIQQFYEKPPRPPTAPPPTTNGIHRARPTSLIVTKSHPPVEARNATFPKVSKRRSTSQHSSSTQDMDIMKLIKTRSTHSQSLHTFSSQSRTNSGATFSSISSHQPSLQVRAFSPQPQDDLTTRSGTVLSLSASDYHVHMSRGAEQGSRETLRQGSVRSRLTRSPPIRKLKLHVGKADMRALSARNAGILISDLEALFIRRGFTVESTGEEKGEYRMKVVKPGVLVAATATRGSSKLDMGKGVVLPREEVASFVEIPEGFGLPIAQVYGSLNRSVRETSSMSADHEEQEEVIVLSADVSRAISRAQKNKEEAWTSLRFVTGFTKKIQYIQDYGVKYNSGFTSKGVASNDGPDFRFNTTEGLEASAALGSLRFVDEMVFYVELMKMPNLPGTCVVDFQRVRGDIWTFKEFYSQISATKIIHLMGSDPPLPLVKRIQFGSLELDDVVRIMDVAKLTATFDFIAKWESTSLLLYRNATPNESASPHEQQTESIPVFPSNHPIPQSNGQGDPTALLPPLPMESTQNEVQSAKPKAPLTMSWAKIAAPKIDPNTQLSGASVNGVGSSTPSIATASQPLARGIEKFFSSYKISLKSHLIKPRGLKNSGNMCFMNAILQPLLHCMPFYNLIKQLGEHVAFNLKEKTPLIDAFCTFFNEFEEEHALSAKTKRISFDAFEPEYVYNALRTKSNVDSMKGRQEDAEEFLGFLLDGLHEELLLARHSAKALSRSNSNGEVISPASSIGSISHTNSEGWVEVGSKHKTATTRSTEVSETPIVQIFGGKMRTILKAVGDKDKAMLEPFMALPLDIAPEHILSIEDGLLNMTAPEIIPGYTSITGFPVDVSKQNYVDFFPPVLILHLKRFVFDGETGTTQKLRKHISFKTSLKIKPEVVSPAGRKQSQYLEYALFAVINHHGKYTEGGHYTCDVYRNNEEWLRIDDDYVEKISGAEVTKERDDRQAYMLFYSKS